MRSLTLFILAILWPLALAACSAPPHIVFIAAEDEYRSELTLASLAKDAQARGWSTTLLTAAPDQSNPSDIPGLEALDRADLVVMYLRFRTLPAEQVAHLDRYLKRGGPVVGLRTSTHAFAYPPEHPLVDWNNFGQRVLGAPWIRHFGHDSTTDVTHAPTAARDPLLEGVAPAFHLRSWLYDLEGRFPPPGARILLMGQSCDAQSRQVPSRPPSPVAWTHHTPWNSRVFMTTLGHPEDFDHPSFRALMRNAMDWAIVSPSTSTVASSKRADPDLSSAMPTARAVVVGVHPIIFTKESFREIMLRWNGPDTEYESEAEFQEVCDAYEEQIRRTMSGLHLIELQIDEAPAEVRLDKVSQDASLTDFSQVPHDEHWLSADGHTCVGTGSNAPSIRPVRAAFFLHVLKSGFPLYGPWGELVLPPPTPLPDRLRRLVPYDPPT